MKEFITNLKSNFLFLSLLLLSAFHAVVKAQTQTHTTVTKAVLENLGPNVNSSAGELHPLITADGKTLYYVRDGHSANFSTQDVWYSEKNGDTWGAAQHPGEPLNMRGKNSGVSNVSTDGNQLLIRGAFEDGEYVGSGLSVLERNKKGEWKYPRKLEIVNYKKYSDMGSYNNSVLTPDGKHILFAFSDDKNNGNHDLYVSHLVMRDKWQKPASIKDFTKFVSKALNHNTWTEPEKIKALSIYEYTEMSPFMAADGVTMYYSSNMPGGFGNNDIYMTKRLDDTWQNWSKPVNLGSTVNSNDWDAYYTLDARGEEAYLTSSANSLGGSDIVKVKLVKELRPNPVVLIRGKVFNAKTKEPLSANIEYENLQDGKNMGVAVSNPLTGEYKIVLPYGINYGFMAFAEKFISVSDNLDLEKVESYKEITRDLYLVPLEVGSTIRLNNIFFDVNKADLRPESFPELDRLVGLMGQNAKMQIQISGHTDNVGSDEANLKLSNDRAKAVMDYILKAGIEPTRISFKGYGEQMPLSSNDTEEGKQLNRRVEFTILKN